MAYKKKYSEEIVFDCLTKAPKSTLDILDEIGFKSSNRSQLGFVSRILIIAGKEGKINRQKIKNLCFWWY